MEADITFDQIVEIYDHTAFDQDGDQGAIAVETRAVLASLRLIDDASSNAGALSGIVIVDELDGIEIGHVVRARIGSPAGSLGILARNFDDLLMSPRAYTEEPRRFFVVDGRLTPSMTNPPAILTAYRLVVALTALFAEAAAYLHPVRQELMFAGKGKIAVPVHYTAETLKTMSIVAATALLAQFDDTVHKDQKLSILSIAIMAVCSAQAPDDRFGTIVRRLDDLVREVKDGYQLLASEFSYAKIRRDVETAQFEYLNKIHKTFNDIQGQLLAIPVATFVVASQLKTATKCDADFWTDIGVLGGAWLFVVFFLVAILNQWLTLNAIEDEVLHQQTSIEGHYAIIANRFADVFKALSRRIRLQRTWLIVFGVIAVLGAMIASAAFRGLVTVEVRSCLPDSPLPATVTPGASKKAP